MSLDILLQRVACLGDTEHQEIFNILSSSRDISSTRNSNGVFIDLGTVPDSLLEKVRAFVDYCHHNKQHIDDYNNRLVECRISQDFDRLPTYTLNNNDKHTFRPSDVVKYDHDVQDSPECESFIVNKDCYDSHSVSRKCAVARFQQSKKRFNRRKGISSISGYGGLLAPEPYIIECKADLCKPCVK